MNEAVERALKRDRTVGVTTVGWRSGRPRRLEIWIHNLDGRIYISGSPGRRDWFANLRANPEFTLHLKQSVQADLPARARPILDRDERRAVMARILERLGRQRDLDAWVTRSPLVEVELERT